jgi:hypothetical protein
MMPLDEFENILHFFPGLKGVVLCGMYEPLLDPRFESILDIIERLQPKAEITIFTNGSALTHEKAVLLRDHYPNFKNLIVSIHGFSKQVYETVMVGLNRDEVYKNVMDFANLIGDSSYFHLSVSFVRVKQNIGELEAYRKFWQTVRRVDVVSDFEVVNWQGQVPVENLYYELPQHTRECPMFEKPLVIDAYGNVVLCCYNFRQNYGHVLEGGYAKWLNKVRVSSTYPLPECEKCNGWRHY